MRVRFTPSAREQFLAGLAYIRARAMRLYNDTLLEVCRRRGVECLDLAAQVEPNTDNFYDDAHFTEQGSATLAALIADYLLASSPLKP